MAYKLSEMFDYEQKHDQVLPRPLFLRRVLQSLALAGALLLGDLSISTSGYHLIAVFGWVDSFLESSMISTGMGPVGVLKSDGSKLFASLYADRKSTRL